MDFVCFYWLYFLFVYELVSVQPEDYNDVRSKVMNANTEEVGL